jgi:hypothetical protein
MVPQVLINFGHNGLNTRSAFVLYNSGMLVLLFRQCHPFCVTGICILKKFRHFRNFGLKEGVVMIQIHPQKTNVRIRIDQKSQIDRGCQRATIKAERFVYTASESDIAIRVSAEEIPNVDIIRLQSHPLFVFEQYF